MMNPTLKVYLDHDSATMPEVGTAWSACFDLRACLAPGDQVKMKGPGNGSIEDVIIADDRLLTINPGCRALVPTGLIFDLDKTQSLRLHSRSSVPWKHRVYLANSQGIVDADYTDPTYVMLDNLSLVPFHIHHYDRICQADVVENITLNLNIEQTHDKPGQKTDRVGGVGSTGRS